MTAIHSRFERRYSQLCQTVIKYQEQSTGETIKRLYFGYGLAESRLARNNRPYQSGRLFVDAAGDDRTISYYPALFGYKDSKCFRFFNGLLSSFYIQFVVDMDGVSLDGSS